MMSSIERSFKIVCLIANFICSASQKKVVRFWKGSVKSETGFELSDPKLMQSSDKYNLSFIMFK